MVSFRILQATLQSRQTPGEPVAPLAQTQEEASVLPAPPVVVRPSANWAHSTHSSEPCFALYLPGGHAVQLVPSVPKYPALHLQSAMVWL